MREDADLGGHGPQVGGATAVDADALVDDALADDLLGERPEGALDLAVLALERRHRSPVSSATTSALTASLAALRSALSAICWPRPSWPRRRPRPRLEDVVAVVELATPQAMAGLHAGLGDQLVLELDRLADPGLGGLEAAGDDLLGDLGGAVLVVAPGLLGAAGLDHHDGDRRRRPARPATTISKVDSSPSS